MKFPSPNSKTGRVLESLLTGQSYNLFEAEAELRDRSLHSTVSALQNKYGINIARVYEDVPSCDGSKTRCCRYWIDVKERLRIKYEIHRGKVKALTSSDETSGEGSGVFIDDDSAGRDKEQDGFLVKPVTYVRNCLKALGRF